MNAIQFINTWVLASKEVVRAEQYERRLHHQQSALRLTAKEYLQYFCAKYPHNIILPDSAPGASIEPDEPEEI